LKPKKLRRPGADKGDARVVPARLREEGDENTYNGGGGEKSQMVSEQRKKRVGTGINPSENQKKKSSESRESMINGQKSEKQF